MRIVQGRAGRNAITNTPLERERVNGGRGRKESGWSSMRRKDVDGTNEK